MWCFFFFKQKTAYEMRISDWSSDVCSSDLAWPAGANFRWPVRETPGRTRQRPCARGAVKPAIDAGHQHRALRPRGEYFAQYAIGTGAVCDGKIGRAHV